MEEELRQESVVIKSIEYHYCKRIFNMFEQEEAMAEYFYNEEEESPVEEAAAEESYTEDEEEEPVVQIEEAESEAANPIHQDSIIVDIPPETEENSAPVFANRWRQTMHAAWFVLDVAFVTTQNGPPEDNATDDATVAIVVFKDVNLVLLVVSGVVIVVHYIVACRGFAKSKWLLLVTEKVTLMCLYILVGNYGVVLWIGVPMGQRDDWVKTVVENAICLAFLVAFAQRVITSTFFNNVGGEEDDNEDNGENIIIAATQFLDG